MTSEKGTEPSSNTLNESEGMTTPRLQHSTDPSYLLRRVQHGFSSLKGSPPELYKAYFLKFLDSYSYFSFSVVFTLFLSSDFGFSDIEAGTIYGAWGALITVYGLVTGTIVDNLGVAKSLRVGFLVSLVARIGIFLTTSRTVLLFHIFFTLPMGNCLGIPVLTTGIRRYTEEATRGFAFGLFYVVMNVAALISGPIVDMLTIWYKGENNGDINPDEVEDVNEDYTVWSMTSYRAIILSGIASNIAAVLVAFTVREIKVGPHNASASDESSSDDSRISSFRPTGGTLQQILRETLRAPSFRRFLVVCLITLNVRMIFRHLDATLPKYMMREFGPNVAKGTIYAINPALIIILVPIFTAATTDLEPLRVIHWGTYISALSVFFLVFSTSIGACILFVTFLSIGEAIWSPRLYDYTMSVCEEGREGTYMALSSAPLFLAKLPVGFLSGYLLSKYCPEDGERHSKEMWLIIGLLTITSPMGLTLCWNYVSKKDSRYDDQGGRYTELRTSTTTPVV